MDWDRHYAPRSARMTASEIRELLKLLDQPDIISFAGGIPDPALFPTDAIRAAYDRILADPVLSRQALQYSVSEGYQPLRQWIGEYLGSMGAPTLADSVLITNGSQQGLDFLGKLFVGPGDTVVVARPTYLGMLQAFSAYEPTYEIVDLGNDAFNADALRAVMAKRPKLVYVTPDFQNPSGITIPLDQRLTLLRLAHEYQVPVVEDAAYEKLRYDGTPVPSLLALQQSELGIAPQDGLVIYAGTFSKSVVPALRLGWLVGPDPVIRRLVLIKQASDLHTSTLNQMVMAEVAPKVVNSHAAILRKTYSERRDAMLAALERHFPTSVTWTRPEGGMFLWLTLPEGVDGAELLRQSIEEARVAFVPGSAFYPDRSGRNTCRLSFTTADPAKIEDGISRLGALLTRQLAKAAKSEAA